MIYRYESKTIDEIKGLLWDIETDINNFDEHGAIEKITEISNLLEDHE